MTRMLYI